MEFITNLEFVLPILFFVVAFVYSSVGLGGGSSYTSIMVIAGLSSLAIPMLSLTLNLVVSSIGSFNFVRNKHGKISIVLPFLISAIPMSYLGGSLQLPKEAFLWVLLASLIIVSLRIYLWQDTGFRVNFSNKQKIVLSIIIGSILGVVSGIVGIGGGIYLVPLIILFGIGNHKEAAATGAIFIWFVSLSGLISRIQYNAIDISNYMPLIFSVIVGGFLGSYIGSTRLNAKQMERILGLIVLLAITIITKQLLFQ
jgi:hypothetical protein